MIEFYWNSMKCIHQTGLANNERDHNSFPIQDNQISFTLLIKQMIHLTLWGKNWNSCQLTHYVEFDILFFTRQHLNIS